MNTLIAVLTAVSSGLFVWAIMATINEAYARFEEKYSAAGKAELDALYLTLDAKLLMVLSISSGAFLGLTGFLIGGVVVGLILGGFGLFVPLFILKRMKAKRELLFNEQLIDCLGNMSNSLRSGFTVPQSVEMIGREMDSPIGMEFRIAHAEMRLGLPPVEAMQNMTQRMPLADLDLVVTSMSISEGIGGNLSNIFENIADTIRERFRVEGRIKSLSAMGRMQGRVLIGMPFVLVLFMSKFQPQFIEPLTGTTIGQIACMAGLIWLFLGYISIRRIVDIDV